MDSTGIVTPNQTSSPSAPASVPTAPPRPRSAQLFPHWLTVLLFLAVFAYCVPTIPSADMWWHLGAGHFIVQNHSVPHTDPFSSTFAGKPWIAHEWLSGVLFYLAYSAVGASGLLLLTAGVLALAFLLAYLRSGGHLPARILALALGVWATSPIFCVRPQIFTYLLFSIFLLFLTRFFETGSYRPLILLPILSALWVNFHGAYILGPTLILLFAAGAVCDWLVGQADFALTKRRVLILLIACAACFLVVPLNPNGLAMLWYPFATLSSSSIQTGIMEWRSPDFHLSIFRPYVALLFITAGVLALSPKRPRPSQVLLFIFFGLTSLYAMRNLPLFVLVAFPLAAEYAYWPLAWKLPAGKLPLWNSPLQKPLQAGALLLAAVFCAKIATDHVDAELALEQARFPVSAASFLEEHNLPAPLFNSYDFGGYLIWRLYPRYRVYVDGRSDLYGDAFLEDFVRVYEVNTDPRVVLNRDGIRTILVEPRSNLAGFLRTQQDWQRAYEDPVAVIFTR
jgi:hypothetical protein